MIVAGSDILDSNILKKMLKVALLLVLAAWSSSSLEQDKCSCIDVSKVWDGVSFHCKLCKSIPQDLPPNLSFLGIDHFLGDEVDEDDFHRYKKTLTQIRLYTEENTQTNIGIHSFQNLGSLSRLFLNENGMEHFPHLPHSAEIVEMQKNKLKSVPDMYLPNLLELMLDNNYLTEIPGLLIAQKLAVFSVFGNQIKTANLRHLKGLRLVDLGENKLETFPQLPDDVTIVRLLHNEIRTIPKLNLPNLKQLDLSNNKITHIMNGTFDNCPNLRLINLGNNPIEYIHPSQKAWLKPQDEVDLPDGMTIQRIPSRDWMELGIYTMFGLCGVILLLIVVHLMVRRAKAMRYRKLTAKKIWHVDMRTPIYRPNLKKEHVTKPTIFSRGYTRVPESAETF